MVKQRIKPTQLSYSRSIQPKERFEAAPPALKSRSAERALSRPLAHPSPSSQTMYFIQWLRSGKNLDFCLLALCSCILTLLCHHTPTALPTTSSLGGSINSTPIASLSRLDFTIKAGLFTRSSALEEPEQ